MGTTAGDLGPPGPGFKPGKGSITITESTATDKEIEVIGFAEAKRQTKAKMIVIVYLSLIIMCLLSQRSG